MATPIKKKFVSPINHSKRITKIGTSPKFRANLKEFGKSLHQLSNKPKVEQGGGHGKQPFLLQQRRKSQEKRKASHIKYHMGGTIADPLNLNSLINRDPSCVTPQASPMRCGESPVPILEPQDSTDPLNLKCIPTGGGKDVLTTSSKKKKKKKHRLSHLDDENNIEVSQEKEGENSPKEKKSKRKRKRSRSRSSTGEKVVEENQKPKVEGDTMLDANCEDSMEQQNNSDLRKRKFTDEVNETETESSKKVEIEDVETKQTVSTVSTVSEKNAVSCNKEDVKSKDSSRASNHRQKHKLFIYGNYSRYYGKRNPSHMEDPRLKIFKKEWFADKDVLDIGCNVGHVTLSIARDFKPRYIIGNDIDGSLIKAARNNIRYYVQTPVSGWTKEGVEFPVSFALVSGPLAAPVVPDEKQKPVFPHNVIFKQENFVLNCEAALKKQLPMYDTILCLSVTKWIHLNWGDEGIKLLFKRIFSNLRPGGVLILEPQPFASYKRKKNLTDKIRANYNRIELRPEKFIDYLLSDEVGFVAYEVLEQPQAKFPGFQRPLYLLTKGTADKSLREDND